MVAVFFRKAGLVSIVPLERGATVTAHWYVTVCLPQVFHDLRVSRPKAALHGLQLHHDNAPPHRAQETVDFLSRNGIGLVAHPPYSPDLSPNDFFLFSKLKSHLRGKHFLSANEAFSTADSYMRGLETSDWHDCFQQWFQRMKLCIQADGAYFEKF